MSKYAKGTQAMLDAAKNGATQIPFYTVFNYLGEDVVRDFHAFVDDDLSVHFIRTNGLTSVGMLSAEDLLPAKKSKQKKWQNGTQEQLDAAMGNAKLIPKKTYFLSQYGTTKGKIVSRIDHPYNDTSSTYLFCDQDQSCDFHKAQDLAVISHD